MGLIKKLRKAKQEAKPNEKQDTVKTHLRDMIIVPEMIGSVVGVYSGKEFNTVEIKPEMVGHYLAEFSISADFSISPPNNFATSSKLAPVADSIAVSSASPWV